MRSSRKPWRRSAKRPRDNDPTRRCPSLRRLFVSSSGPLVKQPRQSLVVSLSIALGLALCALVWGQPAAPGGIRAITTVPGMPPVSDPTNLYSETTAGKVRPEVAADLPRVYVPNLQSNNVYVDRSGNDEGRRQVPRRLEPAAHRALVGHAHAVGREQRREYEGREPDAHRSSHRQGRQADSRRRPVQHVFLAGWKIGDRRRRGAQAPRFPRSRHDGDPVFARRAALRGHQSCRFRNRRTLCDLHLRVHGHGGEDRSREPQGAGLHPAYQAGPPDENGEGHRRPRRDHLHDVEGDAAGRPRSRPTAACITSPT